MNIEVRDKDTGKILPIRFAFDYTNATVSSTVDGTIPEQWSTEVEDYVKPRRLTARFAIEKTDLINKPGDTIHITKRAALSAAGDLTETTMLEGNEEKMAPTTLSFIPAERGNAIAFTGQAAAKSILEMRQEASELLGDWAKTKIDNDGHAALRNGVSASRILYGGNATSIYDIDSGDKFTPGFLDKVEAVLRAAKVPRFDMFDPDDPGAKNEGYYVCLAHSYQIYDFKQDSVYQAMRNDVGYIEATKAVPKKYQGFDIVWGKTLVYDTDQISFAIPGVGYATKIAKAFIFGPRAFARAIGIFKQGPGFIWNEETFDYKRAFGVALRWYDKWGILNSERLYGLYTYATPLA